MRNSTTTKQSTMIGWHLFSVFLAIGIIVVSPAAAFSTARQKAPIKVAFSPSKLQTSRLHHPNAHQLDSPSLVTSRPIIISSHRSKSRIVLSSTALYGANANNNNDDENSVAQTPRSKLRQLTGFSLTALRTTLRTATGFSLTALRATIRAATGISLSQSISSILKTIISVLPLSLRYFLQPLLIMYYVPLMTLRYYWVGPNRAYEEERRKGHEKLVDGWRKAVEAAEAAQSGGYWPVHLNDDGTITASLPPNPEDVLDLIDGIEKSVAAATTTTPSTA